MKICSDCGHQNPEDIHLCLNCASPLVQTCPVCEHPIPFQYKFCGNCGNRLGSQCDTCGAQIDEGEKACRECGTAIGYESPTSPNQDQMLLAMQKRMPRSLTEKIELRTKVPEGQRREVTILFVEIANFSSFRGELDGEDLYLIIDEVLQILVDVIYKYEGIVEKFTGDGFMALFGLPINHENDPERAVWAGLEMLDAVRPIQERIWERRKLKINIRIGVNTGLIIAGDLEHEKKLEYTVIGDTVKLASRLDSLAEPNTILVSFRTYQRTRPIFNYQAFPPLDREGGGEPIKAYRPLKGRFKPGQIRGLPGLRVPLVGRKHDLEALLNSYKRMLQDRGTQIALISGEAGLGKTRLVTEFRSALVLQSTKIFQGTCASYMRVTPYRVVADLVRNILGISNVQSEAVQREIIRNHLVMANLEHQELYPYLLHALGLAQTDTMSETRLKLLDANMLQKQTYSALRAFLLAESRQMPLVIIFEDLHWVDPVSRDFIGYLLQSAQHVPILFILVSRNFHSTEIASVLKPFQMQGDFVTEIQLKPLSNPEANKLISQLVGTVVNDNKQLLEKIILQSDGNPYYIEEMVRILMDRDGLTRREDRWVFSEEAELILNEVPGTLRDIIMARFDRLHKYHRQLLQKASILGRTFQPRLLQILVGGDHEDLVRKLDELEQRDFLISVQVDIEEGYTFKHSLLKEAIYDTLLKRDRKKLHLIVAQSVEGGSFWLPGEQSEVLAYHFSRSAEPIRSIPHLIQAAIYASRQFANETAAQYFREAIALMQESPTRTLKDYVNTRIGLGLALKYLGEFEEGKLVLEEAVGYLFINDRYLEQEDPELVFTLVEGMRELADIRAREGALNIAIGLLQAGVNLLGPDAHTKLSTHWRRLMDRIAWVYFRQGKLEEAFKLADLALMNVKISEEVDPIVIASLNNTLGGIYWQRSKHAEAIQQVERSLKIYQNLSYYWGMAIAYTNLGVLNFSKGKWAKAVKNFEEADALRKDHGYTPERPTNLKNAGEVLLAMGDFQRAREKLLLSLEISQQLGMEIMAAYAEIGLCRMSLYEENPEQAASHLQQTKQLVNLIKEERDDRVIQTLFLEALLCAHNGDTKTGLDLAQRANRLAIDGGFREEESETARVLGILYKESGLCEEAESILKHSIQSAQKREDNYREAQALYELGRVYLEMEAQEQNSRAMALARQSFDRALQIFQQLGAGHYLQLAQKARVRITDREASSEPILSTGPDARMLQLRNQLGLPEGEWHQAGILHVRWSSQGEVDDELAFETIALLVPPLQEIIRKHGGEIIRHPDSFTAVFGAPKASEDAPLQAVEAAIQTTNYFHHLNSQTQLPINLKLAITMGKVVAGWIGLANGKSFMVAGDPVQIVEKITEVAPPTTVWVSDPVRQATEYKYKYLGISDDFLSNLAGGTVYQLEGLREQLAPIRGLIGLQTAFVGRALELGVLEQASVDLAEGQGGFIQIQGDPGIGKSRLLREFSDRLSVREMTILYAACTLRRSEYAFSLFSGLLFHAIDLPADSKPEIILENLHQRFETLAPEDQSTLPYLELLLGIQPSPGQTSQVTSLEPEQLRRQTFVAVRRFFELIANQKPLVLLCDDVQWVDPISADLLLFLSNLIRSHPILILTSKRATEFGPSDDVLKRINQLHTVRSIQVKIQPLDVDHCRSLLMGIFSNANQHEELISLIVQQSGGNPYFIEEFLRMLIEQNYLRIREEGLEINKELQIDGLQIPSSLEMLIRSRVDALASREKKLLQVASVIGQSFRHELLSEVAQQSRIDESLEILQTRGMIKPHDNGRWLEFSHPLIESIVYNAVLRVQRRIIHSRTARILEKQWEGIESEHAEDLAYHFNKAEEKAKALHYFVIAGRRAADQHASEEALIHFTQASELLNDLDETSEELRWQIAIGLGEVYQFIGNFEASLIVLNSGLSLVEGTELKGAQKAALYRQIGDTLHKMGDQGRAIQNLEQALRMLGTPEKVEEQNEAARIYNRLGWSFFNLGDFPKAQKSTSLGMKSASAGDAVSVKAHLENLTGGIYYRLGDLKMALEHTHNARESWVHIGFNWGVAAALGNIGILEVASGNWDSAFSYFQKSLNMRQEMGDVEGVAIMYNNLGSLARDRGDAEIAETHFRHSLAIAKPFQMAWQSANSTNGLAQALLYKGDTEASQAAILEGITLAEEIGARDVLTEMQITQAELYFSKRDYSQSALIANLAADMAAGIGNRILESSAWRHVAASHYQEGSYSEAEKDLENAWSAISESTDELEIGRVHAIATLIDQIRDRRHAAREHYAQAISIFSRLGAERDHRLLNSAYHSAEKSASSFEMGSTSGR